MAPGKSERQEPPRQRTPPVSTPCTPEESTGDLESANRAAADGHIADVRRQLLQVSEWAATIGDDVDSLPEELARTESSPSWRLTEPFRRAVRIWQSRSAILARPTAMRLRRALRALPLPAGPMTGLKRFVLHRVFGIVPRSTARGAVASAGRRRTGDPRIGSPALPPLSPAQLPDVFMWGIADWHSGVQRPQHLARELAGVGHRVFYLSPQFVDVTGPGFEVEPLDDERRLFVVRLHAQAVSSINAKAAPKAVYAQILASLGRVLEWTGGSRTINLVQHPFWLPFAEVMPNHVLVYDGMDRLAGLGDNSPVVVALEERLLRSADLVTRAEVLRQQIDAIQGPFISVILVTYNNLELTKQCLASLDALTSYPNYEVVVVDNASTDGTQVFIEQWADGRSDRRAVLNGDNRGFAAASNQGLAAAGGEYFVLLNNDTVVTAGWLGTLIGHLRRDPRIGLISAVTNNIDNDARIDIGYADLAGMQAEARLWTTAHLGQTRPMPSVAFFCVAMSREVHREVGPLDEAFGIGMFEDDDYCRRVEQTGRGMACALDVFIHHHSAASFDAMDQSRRWELFERNKQIYEARWGRWPHRSP